MNALKERRVQVAIAAVIALVVVTALLTGILTARASRAGSVGYLRVQEVLSKWPSFLEANKQFNDYADQLQEDYKIDEATRHYGLDVVLSFEYVVTGGVDITEKVTALVNEYSEAAK